MNNPRELASLTAEWREKANKAFRPVDLRSGVTYALEEAAEALSALHRTERVGDFRNRSDDEVDSVARELGQTAFMILSAAQASGLHVGDYADVTYVHQGDPIASMSVVIEKLARACYDIRTRSVPSDWAHISDLLDIALYVVVGVADTAGVDLAEEIDMWMRSIERRTLET